MHKGEEYGVFRYFFYGCQKGKDENKGNRSKGFYQYDSFQGHHGTILYEAEGLGFEKNI